MQLSLSSYLKSITYLSSSFLHTQKKRFHRRPLEVLKNLPPRGLLLGYRAEPLIKGAKEAPLMKGSHTRTFKRADSKHLSKKVPFQAPS